MNPEDVLEVKKMFNTLDPEGIMCSNDGTAILLMRTLEKLNIRIPEQVLMAGFDNLSYLADIKIPLTSISQPVEAMGQLAVQAMLQRIKNPNTPIATVRLPGKMFIRQSSLKPKGN